MPEKPGEEDPKGKRATADKKKRASTPSRKSSGKSVSGKVTDGGDLPAFNYWNYTPEENLDYFQVDMASGLSSEAVRPRLKMLGANEPPTSEESQKFVGIIRRAIR